MAPMSRKKILIADDDPDLRIFLRTSLEDHGFSVVEAKNGGEALQLFTEMNPELLILDVSMGQPDGLDVCREIRMTSSVPIIILTVHDQDLDQVMSLACGADDYITKPVSEQVLKLRVDTQLRHYSARSNPLSAKITVEGLELDVNRHQFIVQGILVPLTRTEFDFLELLMTNPKRVYTREQVTEAIGASVSFSGEGLLDTHASRIRAKIKSAGGPRAIYAIRSVGYRLFE
jgi:DNA-binding response OmpR family regulator